MPLEDGIGQCDLIPLRFKDRFMIPLIVCFGNWPQTLMRKMCKKIK